MNSQYPIAAGPQRIFRKARYGLDKFILVGKQKVHYVEAGQGEPLVLVPGSFRTRRAWNSLLPLLGKEYRLLVLDHTEPRDRAGRHRGFGGSVQEQADLIAVMVRQLGLPVVHLMGGLYTGEVVFAFAARHTDLVGKVISLEGGVARPHVTPDKGQDASAESGLNLSLPGGLVLRVNRGKNLSRRGIGISRRASDSSENEAKGIKSPILYLYGTKSAYRDVLPQKNIEFLKKYLPQAWIVELEGSLHDLALHQPVEIANLVLDFLRARPFPLLTIPTRPE